MYKIFADDTLIFDSTLEDYKIGQGTITKELDKSGSFVFSLYPDHFFYDRIVKLGTVITVYKSHDLIFRGRVLSEATDYKNCKTFTCEGELGFLQDSIIRPYEFEGSPSALFMRLVSEHNRQVDEFKQFRLGRVTVENTGDDFIRAGTDYDTSFAAINSALLGTLGGHLLVTHDDDDPIPTLHWLADFENEASQVIEFGENLLNYTRTVNTDTLATAVIPLGASTSSGGDRLTVSDVNGGTDYIYDEAAVALRGWIFKTVVFDDVVHANTLLKKGKAYLQHVVEQNITIELNALDLHLFNHAVESFNVCDRVRVVSEPHGLNVVMLCNKQVIDLLKPSNDMVTLGYQTASFTDSISSTEASVTMLHHRVSSVTQTAEEIKLSVIDLDNKTSSALTQTADEIRTEMQTETTGLRELLEQYKGDWETLEEQFGDLDDLKTQVGDLEGLITKAESSITQTATELRSEFTAEIQDLDGRVAKAESSITQTATELRSEFTAEVEGIDGRVREVESSITQTADEVSIIVANLGEDGTVTPASIAAKIKDDKSLIEAIADEVHFSADDIDFTAGNVSFYSKNDTDEDDADHRSLTIEDGRISFRNNNFPGSAGQDSQMWFEAGATNTLITTVSSGGYSLSCNGDISIESTSGAETTRGITLRSGHYVYIHPYTYDSTYKDCFWVFTHRDLRFYYRDANGDMQGTVMMTSPLP